MPMATIRVSRSWPSRSTSPRTAGSWRRSPATIRPCASGRPGGFTTRSKACGVSASAPRRPLGSTRPPASTTTPARSARFRPATTWPAAWTRTSSRGSSRVTSSTRATHTRWRGRSPTTWRSRRISCEPGGAMKRTSQRDQAEAFRRLHREGGILVLPNAWDVITARLIESVGFAAIATSSAGVAWALGYADGERISRGEMLAVVRRIASSVRVPVTADMEAGYGMTPEAAAETARGVIAAGAVGLNLEDGTNDGRLVDVALHQDRIRAMRETGAAAGVPLVINARTDAFEVKEWSPTERLTAAVRRANAYRAAGADCLFVPHVSDAATIGRLAREIEGPLNVIAGPPAPTIPELERLGVKRASLGPRLVQAALGLLRRAATELRERGTYDTFTELVIPFTEVQRLVAPTP